MKDAAKIYGEALYELPGMGVHPGVVQYAAPAVVRGIVAVQHQVLGDGELIHKFLIVFV